MSFGILVVIGYGYGVVHVASQPSTVSTVDIDIGISIDIYFGIDICIGNHIQIGIGIHIDIEWQRIASTLPVTVSVVTF